jgi:hypothetical protein
MNNEHPGDGFVHMPDVSHQIPPVLNIPTGDEIRTSIGQVKDHAHAADLGNFIKAEVILCAQVLPAARQYDDLRFSAHSELSSGENRRATDKESTDRAITQKEGDIQQADFNSR